MKLLFFILGYVIKITLIFSPASPHILPKHLLDFQLNFLLVSHSLKIGRTGYFLAATALREDASAASTLPPPLVPPITIILLLFSKATPTLNLALVSKSTLFHEFLDESYRETSDVETVPSW